MHFTRHLQYFRNVLPRLVASIIHLSTLPSLVLVKMNMMVSAGRSLAGRGGGGWLKQGLFGSWHSGFVVVIYSPTKADKPIPTS